MVPQPMISFGSGSRYHTQPHVGLVGDGSFSYQISCALEPANIHEVTGQIVLFTPYAGGSASSTETIKSSKVLKEVLRSSGIYHSRNVPTKPLGFRHKQFLERGVMGYALAIVINTVT